MLRLLGCDAVGKKKKKFDFIKDLFNIIITEIKEGNLS